MRTPDTETRVDVVEPVQPGMHGGAGDSAGNMRIPVPRDEDDELEPTIVRGRE
ncbi:hypothetical protein [Prauserella muralis]|uniref:hypothetical protein n=1 Tax=Prauserella muralis TaxID=588067 RepID=UPI0011ADE57D|nr:hypothetical protein [Prauserella muralis]TWE23429.1 hypothetical protein FHX69_4693 [Prauserella muralis]